MLVCDSKMSKPTFFFFLAMDLWYWTASKVHLPKLASITICNGTPEQVLVAQFGVCSMNHGTTSDRNDILWPP